MPNEYYPTKDELIQHIQTLNSLIDGESDELGQMLTPIVYMLEKMTTTLLAKSQIVEQPQLRLWRMDITTKLEHWRRIWPYSQDHQDLFPLFTSFFDKRDLLEATDVYINTISPHDKESFENGGAVYVTVVWLLMGCPKAGFLVSTENTFATIHGDSVKGLKPATGQLVDKVMQHYGLTSDTVTPLCAIRKVLAAEIHRRNAWRQLAQLFPWADYNAGVLGIPPATSIVDGVSALVSKLDHSHQVYDIDHKVLEDLVRQPSKGVFSRSMKM